MNPTPPRPSRGKAAAKPASGLDDCYVRVEDYAALVDDVHFPPEVWAVFAHLERPVSAADLATRLKTPAEDVLAALRRLARRKLVRKHLLGWKEYVARSTPAADAPIVAAQAAAPAPEPARVPIVPVPASSPVAPPVLVTPPSPPVNPAPEPAIVSVRLVNDEATRRRREHSAAVIRFQITPEAPRPAPAKPEIKAGTHAPIAGWRLRPILDAIMAKAEGLTGQFLVYRVFLRVPTELMASAGLKSLSLVDDSFRIRDARLRDAILRAAREVAELNLESVPA